jgi:hypothetical protein
LALAAAIAWLLASPSWEPLVATATLVATLIGVMMMKKKGQGRGGNAVVAGESAAVDLHNEGTVQAGKGGTGGSGGDAIHVASGVRITIVNRGVIAGGDAGEPEPGKGDA